MLFGLFHCFAGNNLINLKLHFLKILKGNFWFCLDVNDCFFFLWFGWGFIAGSSSLSFLKNLKLLAMIRGKISDEEIKEAIRFVGLDPDNKKHVGKYSLGMRQRLGLAQALMEHPDILLLDEPLSGLDNEGVKEMHQLLLKQKEQGRLLLVASHSKEDIDVLCDEIFYFDKGKIIDHVLVNE